MMYIVLDDGKRLAQLIHQVEGIVRILKVADPIKNALIEDINDIKAILKGAKLQEAKDENNKSA